ncbi:MAG: ABC transporter permease [Planctomycetes bacterium]|nr:ABC transporter permease [Planctomycetota bacterium]
MLTFRIKRTLRTGLKSLWRNKLRSGLTVLGITFGVCSVIAMLAIGQGASYEAQEQIKALGSNNIILQSVKPPQSQDISSSSSRVLAYGLTFKDARRIRETVPGVEVITQARKVRETVFHGRRQFDTNLVGTVPWYPTVTNARPLRGRFFNHLDMDARKAVCVLGQAAEKALFPLGGACGQLIRAGKRRYRVIGILSSLNRGEVTQLEQRSDPDSDIYVPLSTLQVHFGKTVVNRSAGSFNAEQVELHELIIQVDRLDRVTTVHRIVEQILAQDHKQKDYKAIVPLQLLEQARRTKRIFSIVLGSIAAISLLVGGIGIMNITLATIMERTREIGIRRAMGAKKRHIVEQFLTETVLLSIFGGLLGIALGISLPYFVTRFAGMSTIVTGWSLLLAFGISASVGLIFGIYPAYRAANLDPIDALRHE